MKMQQAPALTKSIPLLAGLLACAPPPDGEGRAAEAAAPPTLTQQPIVGGTRATTCQWPTAVGLDGCTGTLVHPRLVTTAAHCLAEGGPAEVTFGETWSGSGVARRVAVAGCRSAEEDSGIEGDLGYCVLAEAVEDVPIVPVLQGCETQILRPGQRATLVGFGRRGGLSFALGVKYQVEVTLGDIVGNDIALGSSRRGACHGDSGGPAYVQLGDGTWRVFGATSRGSLFCNDQTIYTLIHPFVAWMERTSGFDVTPCHEADGRWSPGPGCAGFPLAPGAAGGAWAEGCGGGPRAGAGATCGPAAPLAEGPGPAP